MTHGAHAFLFWNCVMKGDLELTAVTERGINPTILANCFETLNNNYKMYKGKDQSAFDKTKKAMINSFLYHFLGFDILEV